MSNKKEVYRSLHILIKLQKSFAHEKQNGYALLMTSVMSILMFSILSMYLFSSRLHKSTANAIVDSGSTFYASETALNKRANIVRQKFSNYTEPDGESLFDTSIATRMNNCIDPSAATALKGGGDYACITETIHSKEAILSTKSANGDGISNEVKDVNYMSYTFVKPTQRPGGAPAELKVMDSGDYKGLRALDYRYRVYSTAIKQSSESADKNVSAQSMLQMEFINRIIPVFQFAVFYENMLEITSTNDMVLDGPVHTNKSLHLAPGGLLTLNGTVTFVDNVYRSLLYQSTYGSDAATGQRTLFSLGGPYASPNAINCKGITNKCISSAGAFSSSFSSSLPITASNITDTKGQLKKQTKLVLPPTGFLSNTGTYFNNADLRVQFNPSRSDGPFKITSINRSTGASTVFNDELIKSLQKPVLLRVDSFATDKQLSAVSRLCPRIGGGLGEATSYTDAIPAFNATNFPTASRLVLSTVDRKKKVISALNEAIAKTSGVTYLATKSKAANTGSIKLRDAFDSALSTVGADGLPEITNSTDRSKIIDLPINVIAALNVNTVDTTTVNPGNGGCFLPAPMRVLTGQRDRKEIRDITILQSNIKSLAVWNKDGVYLNGANISSTDNLLFAKKAATVIPDAQNAKAIANANCDYECLGLAASDQTENGLVWHFSMIDRNSPYSTTDYTSGNGKDRIASNGDRGLSPYGFAFSGGTRLPAALTIASDQAVYTQGDYNNPSSTSGDLGTDTDSNPDTPLDLDESQFTPRTATYNSPATEKKPASILSDSITILSNSCYNGAGNHELNCLNWATTTMPTGSSTVVRAAILSGTDQTVINSSGALVERGTALNNHIRMLEDWTGSTFKYRGSLVSQGPPKEFSGRFFSGCASCYFIIPTRDFGFDRDFNRADGLPPLAPGVSYLQQQVFKRDYDSNNR
jgi:hypothetical protein